MTLGLHLETVSPTLFVNSHNSSCFNLVSITTGAAAAGCVTGGAKTRGQMAGLPGCRDGAQSVNRQLDTATAIY